MRIPRESDIKIYMLKRCAAHRILPRKVRWEGRNGAPDWVLFYPNGKIIWVELKAPGKTPDMYQEMEHDYLRLYRQDVRVVDSFDKVNKLYIEGMEDGRK